MGPSHEILNQIFLSPPFGKKSLTGKVNCQLTFSHCPRRLCVQGRFCLEQPVTLHLNFPRDTLWGWRRRGVQPWRATPACVAGHESGALASRCPSGVPAVAVPGASRRPRQKLAVCEGFNFHTSSPTLVIIPVTVNGCPCVVSICISLKTKLGIIHL